MTQSTQQLSPEKFPVGQRVSLPGHFLEAVTLEGIRFIGSGYECRCGPADEWRHGTRKSSDEEMALLQRGGSRLGNGAPM
jgi:hypothetical protein